jgi:hypothetical protein
MTTLPVSPPLSRLHAGSGSERKHSTAVTLPRRPRLASNTAASVIMRPIIRGVKSCASVFTNAPQHLRAQVSATERTGTPPFCPVRPHIYSTDTRSVGARRASISAKMLRDSDCSRLVAHTLAMSEFSLSACSDKPLSGVLSSLPRGALRATRHACEFYAHRSRPL